MSEERKITGGCHCGAVRFEAYVPERVRLLQCNCSICSMTGYLHCTVPQDRFRLISPWEELTCYRFHTGLAEHLFCRRCGIKSFYRPRSHLDCWSIHYLCIDEACRPEAEIVAFDGRNWEQSASRLDGSELGQA